MEKKIENQDVENEVQEGEVISESNAPEKSKGSVLSIIMLLLVVGAYAGGYWLWQQLQSVNGQVEQQLTELMVPVAPATVDTSAIEQSIQEAEDKFLTQFSTLQSEQKILTDNVDVLRKSQQLTKADVEFHWIMSEVKYLLNVANQRVLLAKDARGAGEAIELADDRVKALADYRLHPLRALFAEELLALSAINKIDVEGMSLQLESALAGIDGLQVLMANPVTAEQAVEPITSDDWQGAMGQAWQQVKSLVVIRHQQDGSAAVLVPEQRYFLYQNLKLKLESVRFALLTGNQMAFDANLSAASQWLQEYFVGDERDAMSSLIDELSSVNIKSDMPDISASLAWLRGFEQ